jgi:hypothetical protein
MKVTPRGTYVPPSWYWIQNIKNKNSLSLESVYYQISSSGSGSWRRRQQQNSQRIPKKLQIKIFSFQSGIYLLFLSLWRHGTMRTGFNQRAPSLSSQYCSIFKLWQIVEGWLGKETRASHNWETLRYTCIDIGTSLWLWLFQLLTPSSNSEINYLLHAKRKSQVEAQAIP